MTRDELNKAEAALRRIRNRVDEMLAGDEESKGYIISYLAILLQAHRNNYASVQKLAGLAQFALSQAEIEIDQQRQLLDAIENN